MCLPTKTDKPSSSPGSRSILGMGAVTLLACLGGPALVGAIGGRLLFGAGGMIFALALCAAVPAVVVALRRRGRSMRPLTTPRRRRWAVWDSNPEPRD